MIDFMLIANLDKLFVDFRSCSMHGKESCTAARMKTMFIYLICPRKFCLLTQCHSFAALVILIFLNLDKYYSIYICSQFHPFKLVYPFCLPKSAVGLTPSVPD